jgi:indole-3-glycerol phosphate synthase
MTILDRIVARKREELAQRRRVLPPSSFRDIAPPPPRDFTAALRQPGLSAIAEIKRRSPSRGPLYENLDPARLAECYQEHGARAVSVLTDADFFGGSDDDLRAARKACELPILRKDFIIDEYQIREARAIGADAILLIVRILSTQQLQEYRLCAAEQGLAALLEVHDGFELDRALVAGAAIVGINARDLDTFETDLARAIDVRRRCPAGILTVAESAIKTRADVAAIQQSGFDAILVGETLVRAVNPGAKLRELLEDAS